MLFRSKRNEKGELEVRTSIGTARIIRDSLPNATYIGFTGTPISSKDRSTREVFGDYIDIYDMTQAVEDGATSPVYYESRVIHLKLDEKTLRLIDVLRALNCWLRLPGVHFSPRQRRLNDGLAAQLLTFHAHARGKTAILLAHSL